MNFNPPSGKGLLVPNGKGKEKWKWRTLEPDGYGAFYVKDWDDTPIKMSMSGTLADDLESKHTSDIGDTGEGLMVVEYPSDPRDGVQLTIFDEL